MEHSGGSLDVDVSPRSERLKHPLLARQPRQHASLNRAVVTDGKGLPCRCHERATNERLELRDAEILGGLAHHTVYERLGFSIPASSDAREVLQLDTAPRPAPGVGTEVLDGASNAVSHAESVRHRLELSDTRRIGGGALFEEGAHVSG